MDKKSRAWFLTLFEQNFVNLEIDENTYGENGNYKELSILLSNIWCKGKKNRSAACVVCKSADGAFHVHMACYSTTPTTLDAVRNLMGKAHCEVQRGSKKQVMDYLSKTGKNAEKGEIVLYEYGLDNVQDDTPQDLLAEAEKMISNGYTPSEIFGENIKYRRYSKEISSAYIDKRFYDMPNKKELEVYWHCGDSGTGKSFTHQKLIEENNADSLYFYNDFSNGGLDKYTEMGCPPILFIDELRPESMTYGSLLNILSDSKFAQTHCRYGNVYNLWTVVHITSVYPPEELYKELVPDTSRKRDTYLQLKRRLTFVVYHYKVGNEYKTYKLRATAYNGYDDIKELAKQYENLPATDKTDLLKLSCQTPNEISDILGDFGAIPVK